MSNLRKMRENIFSKSRRTGKSQWFFLMKRYQKMDAKTPQFPADSNASPVDHLLWKSKPKTSNAKLYWEAKTMGSFTLMAILIATYPWENFGIGGTLFSDQPTCKGQQFHVGLSWFIILKTRVGRRVSSKHGQISWSMWIGGCFFGFYANLRSKDPI
jgi:hypothetical protein